MNKQTLEDKVREVLRCETNECVNMGVSGYQWEIVTTREILRVISEHIREGK